MNTIEITKRVKVYADHLAKEVYAVPYNDYIVDITKVATLNGKEFFAKDIKKQDVIVMGNLKFEYYMTYNKYVEHLAEFVDYVIVDGEEVPVEEMYAEELYGYTLTNEGALLVW